MRLMNWFKQKSELREIVTQPIEEDADRIALARRARAQAEAKRKPPVPKPAVDYRPKHEVTPENVPEPAPEPEMDTLQQALKARMELLGLVDGLTESLGTKVVAAIQSEPYPSSVVVYVLEMLKATVVGQERAKDAARGQPKGR